MKKAILKDESSFKSRPDNRPEHPEIFPPIKGRPGRTNKSNLHTTIAGPPSPSSSKGGPAQSSECYCGQVIATSAGYVDADGEEHDAEYYYRHCELHDPGKKDYWSIASLGDLMKLTDTTFTKEGRAFWKELRRKSDERNPYIAEMEVVKAEIQKIDDELNFMGVAKEKIHEWNQQNQCNFAAGRNRIPFPEWLVPYRDTVKFHDSRKKLEAKRQALMDKKFEIHIEIVNWRYQISNPKGGTL